MWGDYGHMGGYGFGLGWVFTLVFWGLIIWVIVSLVRNHSGNHECKNCHGEHNHGLKNHNNATDIIKERYAKGELSKEDFEKMKKDLE